MDIFVAKLLDCTKGYRQTLKVASQYTSEADLNCFGWTMLHVLRAHSLYPILQATILNLLNPYTYMELLPHSVITLHSDF